MVRFGKVSFWIMLDIKDYEFWMKKNRTQKKAFGEAVKFFCAFLNGQLGLPGIVY